MSVKMLTSEVGKTRRVSRERKWFLPFEPMEKCEVKVSQEVEKQVHLEAKEEDHLDAKLI